MAENEKKPSQTERPKQAEQSPNNTTQERPVKPISDTHKVEKLNDPNTGKKV
jgi:hypothetical protein